MANQQQNNSGRQSEQKQGQQPMADLAEPRHGETDPHHELARKLPQQTGENDTGDVGVRAFPASADANDHGYRKKN